MKNKSFEYGNIWILISILIFGTFLRIWISQFGFNHDFSAWKYNLELFNNGESFYAFEKYNYSPLWIYILHLLDSIYINLENSVEIYNKVRFNYDLSGPQGAFIRFFKNDRQLGSGILYHGQHQSHLDDIDEELFISNLPVFLTNK